MSTLHSYAEAAIRRDLTRARALLAAGGRMSVERRRALGDHLLWLAGLADQGTTVISPAVVKLRAAATAFAQAAVAHDREELVRAIDVVLKATAAHRGPWTAPDVVRIASGNLPWVLDAAAVRGGPGLVLPRTDSPQDARSQAEAYRRKRTMLWGPIALAPLQVLEAAVR